MQDVVADALREKLGRSGGVRARNLAKRGAIEEMRRARDQPITKPQTLPSAAK